jgi:hypothetical protein
LLARKPVAAVLAPRPAQPQHLGKEANMARAAQTTTDHEEIRRWAEARGGAPASVKGTGGKGGDPGMLRIDFPGYSGARSLQKISWGEFFKWFDANELALLYREQDRFNKLVGRETADARRRGQRTSRRAGQEKLSPQQRRAATRKRIQAREARVARQDRGTSARAKTSGRTTTARAKTSGRKRATRSVGRASARAR